MMRPNQTVIDPVARTVTIPLPTFIEMTRGSYGNNEVPTEEEELDDFLMYTYKVKRCPQKLPHNWTDCPYAHRGEKAKRRDPCKFPYQGTACLEWKQREDCIRGKNCEYAHGVFEYWLHPTRFRTKVCDEGLACPRKICFFAHTPQELRKIALPIYARGVSSGSGFEITKPASSVPIPVYVPVPAGAALAAPQGGGGSSSRTALAAPAGGGSSSSRTALAAPAGGGSSSSRTALAAPAGGGSSSRRTALAAPAGGGSSSSSTTISGLCRGCRRSVVIRDNNGHVMTTEEVVTERYRYCRACIVAAERAAIVAMTTHAFAAPMTGRQRGRGDYVPLPPLMASPAAPDEGASEEIDLSGLPHLSWVQDLID